MAFAEGIVARRLLILGLEALLDPLDQRDGRASRIPKGTAFRHLLRQFGKAVDRVNCIRARDDVSLHQKMEQALAQHQRDLAVRIGG